MKIPPYRKGKRWEPYELDILRKYYSQLPTDTLAEIMGRNAGAVHERAFMIGLISEDEYDATFTPLDFS